MELPTETMGDLGSELGNVSHALSAATDATVQFSAAVRGRRAVKFSDLCAGDSFAHFPSSVTRGHVLYVDHVYEGGAAAGDLRCINDRFELVRISRSIGAHDDSLIAGFTNRRAKRQRCKMRRRARFARSEATA